MRSINWRNLSILLGAGLVAVLTVPMLRRTALAASFRSPASVSRSPGGVTVAPSPAEGLNPKDLAGLGVYVWKLDVDAPAARPSEDPNVLPMLNVGIELRQRGKPVKLVGGLKTSVPTGTSEITVLICPTDESLHKAEQLRIVVANPKASIATVIDNPLRGTGARCISGPQLEKLNSGGYVLLRGNHAPQISAGSVDEAELLGDVALVLTPRFKDRTTRKK